MTSDSCLIGARTSKWVRRFAAAAAKRHDRPGEHLTSGSVHFRVNQAPNSTRRQIFLRDPNNVEIELNFEVKNEAS